MRFKRDVKVLIECRIGSAEIGVRIYDANTNDRMREYTEEKTAMELKRRFRLNQPCFTEICRTGLPYWVK